MVSIFLLLLIISPLILMIIAEYKDRISSIKTEEENKKKENNKTYESKYESYKSYNYTEEDNQRKLEKILNLVIKDFNNSPYNDKYICKTIGNNIYFHYTFNNGYVLIIRDEYLFLSNSYGERLNSFTLDTLQLIQIYKLITKILDNSVNRDQRTYSQSNYDKYSREYRAETEPKVESSGNTKLDKILEKIKLREEQLSKMRSNDPERSALQNELNTYKNIANKMKSKF